MRTTKRGRLWGDPGEGDRALAGTLEMIEEREALAVAGEREDAQFFVADDPGAVEHGGQETGCHADDGAECDIGGKVFAGLVAPPGGEAGHDAGAGVEGPFVSGFGVIVGVGLGDKEHRGPYQRDVSGEEGVLRVGAPACFHWAGRLVDQGAASSHVVYRRSIEDACQDHRFSVETGQFPEIFSHFFVDAEDGEGEWNCHIEGDIAEFVDAMGIGVDGPAVEPVDLVLVFGQDLGLGEAVFFGYLGEAIDIPGCATGDQGDVDFWFYSVDGGFFGPGDAVLGAKAIGKGKDGS